MSFLSKSCTERDAFSVAVIIFEILVGTKLILLGTDHVNLKILWDRTKSCLDEKTKAVLNYMLFFGDFVALSCYRSSDKEEM